MAVGALAMQIERAVVPANHVTCLIPLNQLDTDKLLHWQGCSREVRMAPLSGCCQEGAVTALTNGKNLSVRWDAER
jgi:hypothetical protein